MSLTFGNTPIFETDAEQIFELSKDDDIRREFAKFRFDDIEHVKIWLKNQIYNTTSTSFFKVIRIIYDDNATIYNTKNSLIIGFISLLDSGPFEMMLTGGFKQNLRYAIKTNYRCKGLMTTSLNMLLDAMKNDSYNLVPAFVKPSNKPSVRVLQKCGFDKIRETELGFFYVRRLDMNEQEYKRIFSI